LKFKRYGLGILKGLSVTIRHLFRHPTVTQYPEQWLNISRRSRGNELVWSREKCTGCATCAKTCPQGVIHIETSPGEENNYTVEKFEVDTGYCISCGLCVEACPYNALFMGYAFELGKYRRGALVLNRDQLVMDDRKPSSYFHPELDETLPEQTLLINRKE